MECEIDTMGPQYGKSRDLLANDSEMVVEDVGMDEFAQRGYVE